MSPEANVVVMSATNVEAFRIQLFDDRGEPMEPKGRPVIAYDRIVVSKLTPQPKEWVKSLRSVLLELDKDARLQGDEFAKPCEPNPGVAIRFTSPKGKMDLLLCFECEMMTFATVDSKKILGWKNFDTYKGKLIGLAKRAFPKDKDIQSLE